METSTEPHPDRAAELILPAIARGQAGAVRRALDVYGPLVWSIARTYCRAQHDAEDAVQEAFVKVWRAAPKYDPGIASEAAFVATVARNAVIDFRRRRPKETTTDFSHDLAEARRPALVAPATGVPDRSTSFPADAQRAVSALRMLSPEQQEAIRLTVQRGLTQQEAATALSVPLGTVKTRVRSALLALNSVLSANARRPSSPTMEAAR